MGIAAGVLSAIPYLILLLLPVQTWVLAAADSYSHYATLPVAFWGTAALIDLGRSALPFAHSRRSPCPPLKSSKIPKSRLPPESILQWFSLGLRTEKVAQAPGHVAGYHCRALSGPGASPLFPRSCAGQVRTALEPKLASRRRNGGDRAPRVSCCLWKASGRIDA